jgi:nanoRNase/pAp phosphatase (c-di-AMP/oligoRNAs hydrolase)
LKVRVKTRSKLKKLKALLKAKSRLIIVIQDNPDPDSIASAVALSRLANALGDTQCSITYDGTVGRAENRALVRYLDLNLRPCDEIDFEMFPSIGLVDTQPNTGNNCLPERINPNIVIDHHPCRAATRSAPFTDIRSRYGATATILLEYLRAAKVTLDTALATGLLYAIRSDTQDLGREATKADIEAIGFLFPRANKRMLSEIQRGSVQRPYFQMLAKALQNARVFKNCITTTLEQTDNPDMIGEVADLLLRDEDTDWVMCSGYFSDKMFISIRTSEHNCRADSIIQTIVDGIGTGGGHQTYAGGQIPLQKKTKQERSRLERLTEQRFLRAVGADPKNWAKLIP